MKKIFLGVFVTVWCAGAQEFPPREEAARKAVEETRRAIERSERNAVQEAVQESDVRMTQSRIALMKAEIEQEVSGALFALQAPPQPPQPPHPASAPHPAPKPLPPGYVMREWPEDQLYQRGQRALAERQYEHAIEYFTAAAQKKGSKADGALYWKAYALDRLGKRDEALATLDELKKSSPNSRWMNEAKALELQVRQRSGQASSPESETDEDLKLIAMSGLANSEPERAIPLVIKMLESASSLRMKERALYVLAQTRSPQVLPVLMKLAKGGGNPDLQRKAIEYLGVFGAKETGPALSEIYASTNDMEMKRSVLNSLQRANDKDRLVALARSETNEELRREAIQSLGGMNANEELWQLYSDSSGETKVWVLRSIGSRGGIEKLLDLARNEKDLKARGMAVQLLGRVRTQQAADALIAMYASETEPAIRKSVASGLHNQGNAKALVEIARKETNLELKRFIVERLSNMRSKEANDYLIELLNK